MMLLKAKLENIERKYAKKRRHDNLGGKYLVRKKELDCKRAQKRRFH